LALGLPLSLLALNGGMKEHIILPLLPAIIICWKTFSNLITRVGMIVGGIFILSALQILVNYTRESSWKDEVNYSSSELIKGSLNSAKENTIYDNLNMIGYRVNPTLTRAITMAIVERDGFIPADIFSGIPVAFIPRIIWPSKPEFAPGAMHTQRIFNYSIALENITSSTAPGFFTELYLGGGGGALILFSMLFGYVVARIQISLYSHLPSPAINIFNFTMIYYAIRFDEKNISYALTEVVQCYFILLIFFKIMSIKLR
jgi:hypothetical protein